MDIELRTSTKSAHLDDLLRGLILRFEQSFPARIRSYYLGGSFSDGTAVGSDGSPNASDIDLFLIFRGTIEGTEYTTFSGIVAESRLSSPIQVDAHAYADYDLLQQARPEATQIGFLNALIRAASAPIYGDDIRAELPDVPFSCYVLDVIINCVFNMSIPRQRKSIDYPLETPLVPPLTYPDPRGEFYGYDIVPARPDAPRGTRVFVGIATWIATLILALETEQYACQKSQSMLLCKKHLPDDRRTQFAATIYDVCKRNWGYVLPTSPEDRAQLHTLCRDTLALENECLRLCRNYLLTQLQQGGIEERRQAARILQNVVFRDAEIMTMLQMAIDNTDALVSEGAAKALEIAQAAPNQMG